MDARRLHRKNAEAFQLVIELSEREANKEATTKAKAVSNAKEQDRLHHTLSGMRGGSNSSHLTDSSTSNSYDDAPTHVDAYTEEGHNRIDDRMGKGPTNARRLRRKNAEAFRLAIELSRHEANKEATTKAMAASNAKKQDRLLRRLSGMRCSSDIFDLTDNSTSSSGDDAPSHVDAYIEEGHKPRRRSIREGVGEEMVIFAALPHFCLYFKYVLSSL
ncbi:Polygalacturonase ADPG1 [Hordeum vulgare]|nr:Polygalacturonase ADPG1 [Hordeum vulgare]